MMTLDKALTTKQPNPNPNDPTFANCFVAGISDFFFSQWLSYCFMEAENDPENRHWSAPIGKIEYGFWNGKFFELNIEKQEVYYRPDLDKYWIQS